MMYIITARRADECYYLSKKEFLMLPKDPREALEDAYSFFNYEEAERFCKDKRFEIKGELVELTNSSISGRFNLDIRSVRVSKPNKYFFEEEDVKEVFENDIDLGVYLLVVSFDGVVSLLKRDGNNSINNFACSNGEVLSYEILKNLGERQNLIHSEYIKLLDAWHGHITSFGEFCSGGNDYSTNRDINRIKAEITVFLETYY